MFFWYFVLYTVVMYGRFSMNILTRYIWLFLLIAVFQPAEADNKAISPDTTIIAFDFHGVVVHLNKLKVGAKLSRTLWNSPYKWFLIKNSWNIFKESIRLKSELDVFDDVLDELILKYPELQHHRKVVHDIVNSHESEQAVLDIIRLLKDKGYSVYMASNISPKSLKTMRRKVPGVLALFDAIYSAHQKKPFSKDMYTGDVKPKPGYYVGFREFLKYAAPQDAHKKIIFIDDLQRNIDGALRADNNLIGVTYTSVQQLTNDLLQLNVINESDFETNEQNISNKIGVIL